MAAKKDQALKPESNELAQEKMAFIVWFDGQVRAKKLKPYQQRELLVFFKEKGLSDSEIPDKYSELLKLY